MTLSPRLRRFIPLLGLLLFLAALALLRRELAGFHYHEVLAYLEALPGEQILLAVVLTVLSYVALTGYDLLGLSWIGQSLPYRRIALASFIGYAVSNNLGQAMLTGAPLRFRLYTAWGLGAGQIARVLSFSVITFWFGYTALSGLVLTFWPLPIPAGLPLPGGSTRALGVVLLALALSYAAIAALRRRPLTIRGWTVDPLGPRLVGKQLLISTFDWLFGAAVLYALLAQPTELHFLHFLGAYLLAQIAGLLSQVPGGLGVFEGVMVVLLGDSLGSPSLLAALFAFRAVYYLLPLLAASLLLALLELRRRREQVLATSQFIGRWAPAVVPRVLAFTTFLGGAILLFSGSTPAVSSRLAWLNRVLPLPVIEISHLAGSVVGIALLLLARGLQRRIYIAYQLTLALLGAGIVVSLLKGLDYEEAMALAIMFAALLPCHRYFHRRASLIGERFTPGWIAAVLVVLVSAAWLTELAYSNAELSNQVWWRFGFGAEAPRSLRALVMAAVVAAAVAAGRLLRPAPPEPGQPTPDDLEKALEIARGDSRLHGFLAQLGDKTLLFNQERTAFLMYAIEGRSWVALGDPIGPREESRELCWRFRELCDHHGGWPVFYQVGEDDLGQYVDLGLTLLKLGEIADVPLEGFSLEGSKRKEMRQIRRRLEEREGCTFDVLEPPFEPAVLKRLERISDAWLEDKNTREKSFSLGFFETRYVSLLPAAVVLREGEIVAFANVLENAAGVLSVDLMRYGNDAPKGVMDYLFAHLMSWGAGRGLKMFSLGMAPLAGLDPQGDAAPLWNRLGHLIFRHGEHFYNFQGLRHYKDKFEPRWESSYLASPGGLALPEILTNVASLISGGVSGILIK